MSTPITGTQFQVDLQQLEDAVESVGGQATHLHDVLGQMMTNFNMVASAWTTPTSPSYELTRDWFFGVSSELSALIYEIVARLKYAHDTYVNAEQTNTGNST
ncbi:WXG100 family type VII secretion target [Actinacidiphila oryziradicis]|uniref:WXG100 family type VII secretion target n=1 Tax=Actinacidiphila oryziradicis TaxID=2571141 RepID=A0A4U0S017_9ACTN|nr:hypothetical protein [Actinacidiphila oryziradicis]TKA02072.1 hypothetical protein FCI23_39195 [Actinacidiphila oryziradicis]